MKISFAGQPEIVLANQKDDFYQFHLKNYVEDAVMSLFGIRHMLRFGQEWRLLSDMAYYGLTTMLGNNHR
jgi:peroxin-10